MTLHILFLTITISKRKVTAEQAMHQEMVEKLYEQNKDRQMAMYRNM
ncbi:YrzI family small protein [Neobacillus sp. Marseille-QA0830]